VAARPGQTVVLLAEDEVIFRAPPRLVLDLAAGTRVSLFPMGACTGRSTGLRWPIDGLNFAPGGRIGTSNEVAAAAEAAGPEGGPDSGPVVLEIDGPMLVLLPKAHLAAVLSALLPPSARGG
jgi:thiamine pyrophosphokinase